MAGRRWRPVGVVHCDVADFLAAIVNKFCTSIPEDSPLKSASLLRFLTGRRLMSRSEARTAALKGQRPPIHSIRGNLITNHLQLYGQDSNP
jgi:hypothetical protein